MYQALGESLNLPAVWLLHQIGLDKGYEKTKFGIPLSEKDRYYGLALGDYNGCFATNHGGSL